MNLFDILKQFKSIEPDPHFTEKSKRMVLATPQKTPALARQGLRVMFRIFETSAAVVLAGFFILLITGGFQGSRYLAPVQYSVVDPQGLKAEAQAVDMQIQLANVNYSTPTSSDPAPVPTPATRGNSVVAPAALQATSSATSSASIGEATATATSTGSSTLSVDQALRELSK